eukprot:gb/GECG01006853.1/.p1 GENE.gb/GECG01006853.1/~~gb/GECG01006853.1/.p1  ORF type:complete len:630 (+),score=116.76 gb/GECG01006853.1/:1-1890(+)
MSEQEMETKVEGSEEEQLEKKQEESKAHGDDTKGTEGSDKEERDSKGRKHDSAEIEKKDKGDSDEESSRKRHRSSKSRRQSSSKRRSSRHRSSSKHRSSRHRSRSHRESSKHRKSHRSSSKHRRSRDRDRSRSRRSRSRRSRSRSRERRHRRRSRSPSDDENRRSESEDNNGGGGRSKVTNSVAQLLQKLGGGVAQSAMNSLNAAPPLGGSQSLQSFTMNGLGMGANAVATFGNFASNNPMERVERELYVGNLPSGIQPKQIHDFFKAAMKHLGVLKSENPIQAVRPAGPQERFCFIEFSSTEEANSATLLSGINLLGMPLKIGRPKSYTQVTGKEATIPAPEALSAMGGHSGFHEMGGITSAAAAAAPMVDSSAITGASQSSTATTSTQPSAEGDTGSVKISNFGEGWTAGQLKELVEPFGEVKTCYIAEGVCYAEFTQQSNAQMAAQGLNDLDLGDRKLQVEYLDPEQKATDNVETKFVQLRNILICEHLSDEEEYSDILEDVREEAENFGNIVQVQPAKQAENPSDPNSTIPMFLEFSDTESAAKCFNALRGRKFDGRVVEAKYVNVEDTPFGDTSSANQDKQQSGNENTETNTSERNPGSSSEAATVSATAIQETGIIIGGFAAL